MKEGGGGGLCLDSKTLTPICVAGSNMEAKLKESMACFADMTGEGEGGLLEQSRHVREQSRHVREQSRQQLMMTQCHRTCYLLYWILLSCSLTGQFLDMLTLSFYP